MENMYLIALNVYYNICYKIIYNMYNISILYPDLFIYIQIFFPPKINGMAVGLDLYVGIACHFGATSSD